jgi:3-phosphoshikimate 1-carboxyvinyltransferase
MRHTIAPAKSLRGLVRLPGDKSISHRYAMLSAIAEGTSRIRNYSTGADCQSTLGAVRALGISVAKSDSEVTIEGRGLRGLGAPVASLDAGNSGSTIRMLSGILAAQDFECRIGGDESLSRRPMERIMRPLGEMGARIEARDGRFPPLHIIGNKLKPIDYTLPVASAQVKSAVLFAGLYTEGSTVVREPVRTRDHSELALREFGADIEAAAKEITIHGGSPLKGCELFVPGDLSSAAFFLVAALLLPGSELVVQGVGLNPTRSALIDFLVGIGGDVTAGDLQQTGGELIGNLRVRGNRVRGGVIEKELSAALIDEIPVLAVLGAVSSEGLEVRDAAELRVKETDRIATVADNFARMGVEIEVRKDGFRVPGNQKFHAADLDSFGDHRIAMAFAVAALAADGPCEIGNAEAASVSFPEFYDILKEIAA